MNLSRLETLVTSDGIERIKKLKILVLGLGGVGGYTVESLVRCGVENITLVDGDIIKPSNINRQLTCIYYIIISIIITKKRIKLINKNAVVNIINLYLTEDNISSIFSNDYTYDYIVDACDTTKVKIALIKECHERGIKLVSSMGTANKLDATKLRITTLDKTDTDPLAKKIRKEFSRKKDIMKEVTVIVSDEKPINTKMLGSSSFVPGVAGLYITNYIIKDVIDNLQ